MPILKKKAVKILRIAPKYTDIICLRQGVQKDDFNYPRAKNGKVRHLENTQFYPLSNETRLYTLSQYDGRAPVLSIVFADSYADQNPLIESLRNGLNSSFVSERNHSVRILSVTGEKDIKVLLGKDGRLSTMFMKTTLKATSLNRPIINKRLLKATNRQAKIHFQK